MKTAKVFKHGGSQAVRIPKEFRLDVSEVYIERRGDEIVLTPVRDAKFRSLSEVARFLSEKFPDSADFQAPAGPKA